MDTLIDQIRAALADDATDDAQQAGAAACRAILATLEARRPKRESETATTNTAAPPRSLGDLPALVALRAMPREQILDHVIAKLRAVQPDAQAAPLAISSVIGALRGMSLDQVLELGLAKLQAALTPRAAPTPGLPPGTRVIRLPPVERRPR